MHIEFLTPDDAAALDIDLPDVYYSADYGRSAEIIDGGVWECAIAQDEATYYPYIKRTVAGFEPHYDIVTPYGYSGIVAPDVETLHQFRAQFHEVSKQRGLVAEFIRTNPLDVGQPQLGWSDAHIARSHPTFVVKLGPSGIDGYWDVCEGRHRTAVRKAQKSGTKIQRVDPSTLLDKSGDFRRLYDATMNRVESSSRMRLPDEYFQLLVEGLTNHLVLFHAVQDDATVAAAVFMRWNDRLHYHLSGSTPDGMKTGATNALLDEVVRAELAPRGALHLGGGLSEGDGLHKFKRSISTDQTRVTLLGYVIDKRAYQMLVAASSTSPETDYFPAYRA